jgi:hypothetical protein
VRPQQVVLELSALRKRLGADINLLMFWLPQFWHTGFLFSDEPDNKNSETCPQC